VLAHFLAGLELDDRAGRDGHIPGRGVGVPPNPRLANLHLEDPEVAQLDGFAPGERVGDVVQGFLNHGQHLLLDEAGFLADAEDEVAFGHGRLGLGHF